MVLKNTIKNEDDKWFEKALEPDSITSYTDNVDMWDYLRRIPGEELTSAEKELKVWLRLEGYWSYMEEGTWMTMYPCCKEQLKDKALKLFKGRLGGVIRLMTVKEFKGLEPEESSNTLSLFKVVPSPMKSTLPYEDSSYSMEDLERQWDKSNRVIENG